MANEFFPPLSDLVDASAIPGDIKFIEDNAEAVIDLLLKKIFYKDLVVDISTHGDESTYSLTLLTKSLRQPLFGTGMELVFFYDPDTEHYASFPIVFHWNWPILRYVGSFDANEFSFTPEEFIKILLQMAGIAEEKDFFDVIAQLVFDSDDDVDAFLEAISTLVSTYDTGGAESPVVQDIVQRIQEIKDEVFMLTSSSSLYSLLDIYETYRENDTIRTAVDAIEADLRQLSDVHQVVINIYAETIKAVVGLSIGIESKFNKLIGIFRPWLEGISVERVKNLIIPQFSVTLRDASMALQFPRQMLVPMVNSGGQWQEDIVETHKASIIFNAGRFAFSTSDGFSIDINEEAELTLPRCLIPGLGIQLEFLKIKLDLSRDTNIPEAIADNRPEDFIGVYIEEASIFLPDEWFKFDEDGSTVRLYGRNILAGTGGVSGTIGLEAVPGLEAKLQPSLELLDGRTATVVAGTDGICNEGDAITVGGASPEDGRYVLKAGGSVVVKDGKVRTFLLSDGELSFNLGKAGNGSWKIGFSQFYLKLWQNKVQESSIKGSLTVPNFKQEGKDGDLRIDITVLFLENADFRITAVPAGDGLVVLFGENGDIFKVIVKSLEAGKDSEKVYIEVSGAFDFSNNRLLKDYILKPIEIKKLRIYSDGTFDIEGGSIPIPGSLHLNLGPVEVSITNITLGSEHLDAGKYKFFGFDCGVSTGGGGLDLRGDGIKVYFNHDGSDMFLRIAGIGVDLVIPGNASEETAALILKGYLSLKETEYVGSVAFKLPKARISGGAAMKMQPKIPAFAVDAFLELSAPIPLGPTGLGIYGFRGMFGLNYVADLPAGATADPEKLFEFYAEKKINPLAGHEQGGLHLGKIIAAPPDSDTPISIGAGISIGTAADNAHIFTMQAFLFLSMPELLLISGRGNILSERLDIVSEKQPPFFAYLALTSDYISVGMGADYKIREEGEILDLQATAKMAYYFSNSSAWYVHVGTKDEPNKAKLLKKIFNLDVYSYLMISASGIETGAGIKFEKRKKYGPVSVTVNAYGDAYAMLSFRKTQAGGGIACGGTVGASVFGVGFDLTLDAYLMLTVPKPYIVKGGMEVCLKVDFWLYTWRKCFDLDFKWEFDQDADETEIKIIEKTDPNSIPVSGFHIGSGNTYALTYFNTVPPDPINTSIETIPLDTFIDVQLKKPVNPNAISQKIGGVTNPPSGNTELVPPKEVELQVTHRFAIHDISIMVWKTTSSVWVNYDPYAALNGSAFLQTVDPSKLKLGYWQKKGKEYNNLRILSNTPFSFADQLTGVFIPEQSGVSAGTMFCEADEIKPHCTRWTKEESIPIGSWITYREFVYRIFKRPAVVVPFPNVFNIPLSLRMSNDSRLEIILPEQSGDATVKLFSFARTLNVTYYDLKSRIVLHHGIPKNIATYEVVKQFVLHHGDYAVPLVYKDNSRPVKKIVIEADRPNSKRVAKLQDLISQLSLQILNGDKEAQQKRQSALSELTKLQQDTCQVGEGDKDITTKNIDDLEKQKRELEKKKRSVISTGGALTKINAELVALERQIENLSRLASIVYDPKTDRCSTYVHEVCFLTKEEGAYNDSIPNQNSLDQEFDDMSTSISKVIGPIWRPDETYYIKITTKETINNTDHLKDYFVAFKTAGPIGHFPLRSLPPAVKQQFSIDENGTPIGQDQRFDKRIEIPENTLKYYLDQKRSYPNPTGNIINAKPLYYGNVSIKLFYTEPRAYNFFHDWPDYEGLGKKLSAIEIIIKDPAEPASPPPTNPSTPVLPSSTIDWNVDLHPLLMTSVATLNYLHDPTISNPAFNANTCWPIDHNEITPAGKHTEVTITNLRPLKLYTAVINCRYAKDGVHHVTKQIHSFNFQTSRYADHTEQVDSYKLYDATRTSYVKAVYDLSVTDATVTQLLLEAVTDGNDVTSNTRPELITQYPDKLQRLLFGYLNLTQLYAAENTEFYLIKDVNNVVIGLYIRSPEAFNDPRTPESELPRSIGLLIDGLPVTVKKVFGRDKSEVIVFANFGSTQDLTVKFTYLLWNGFIYDENQTTTTENLIPSV
ncbi:MAG: hypothetical protein WKF87_11970 [Chryseolinea sp.]